MLKNVLLVGLGGFLGSTSRYLTYYLIDRKVESLYPWSTFTVNIVGSLILGILLGFIAKAHLANDHLRLVFAVGFCGSFTTFSSFMYENLYLFQQKAYSTSMLYLIGSIVLGFIAVFAGQALGRSMI
ncbi:fluoride efflux transporter CrcB [Fulvivirga maritima]|uniref:fluoride efflux transporter CrcB n=1 Tax=Fulvivirga maritima TaxID=2904247 RepID=UPI001F2C1A22|nr:fluoride efflux transporter CrcB [Fulvivirga maritima]UII29168.1 fluoride efflux transporter CrcB [Fulvivirga maritima]